jgi:hypothetical protein
MLRHSTGAKEEFLAPQVTEDSTPITLQGKDASMLGIYFALMVFIGLGNKIFNKLQTIPMHSTPPLAHLSGLTTSHSLPPPFSDYPNFLNLLTTSMYVPVRMTVGQPNLTFS